MAEDHEVSDQVSSRSSPTYHYPFAASPDIIRSQQKDSYFQGVLLDHLSNLLRQLYGARFVHTHGSEAKTFADLLYFGLTTLIGNRTLGEEYCDIVQVEDDTLKLPELSRRAGYILTSILVPYSLTRVLPSFQGRIRAKLEANLRRLDRAKKHNTLSFKIQSYFLEHLGTWTSAAPIHAVTLTIFYFSGAYYELSKRILGLRYIFTKRIGPSEARVGYEVLGVLLLVQMTVQSWLHIKATTERFNQTQARSTPLGSASDGTDYVSETKATELDAETSSRGNVAQATHTPVSTEPRYTLQEDGTMRWIKSGQQRKCILCLDEMKDPAATQCGHVFCWSCIADWIKEKPECPLCRRAALAQHVLPLRQ